MREEPRGFLIVTLRNKEDIEDTVRRVSKISGVVGVEFNHLTRKLLVRYTGSGANLRNVESEVKKVLKGQGKDERKPPRHDAGKGGR